MKKITFYIIIFLFALSLAGCNFLRGGEEDDFYAEDEVVEEGFDESSDEFLVEDEEFGEASEEDFVELDEEDSTGEFDEEGEGFSELDEEGEEFEEETGEKKGFFSRLFGGGKDEEDEYLEDYEEGDFEMEGSFIEESFAEKENTEDSDSVTMTESTTTDNSAETQVEPTTVVDTIEEPSKRKSLNKIIEVAYNKSGFLVNAVYIARPNEDIKNISQKIYRQDRTGDLLAINPHLQNRGVVVGDKIYYNSPNRPKDNRRILFFYEDNNISPSYYNLSKGDNIRSTASQLLGHPNSWKEIWATNPELESKGEIQGSIRIAYWGGGSMPQATAPQLEASDVFAQNDSSQLSNGNLPNSDLKEPNPKITLTNDTELSAENEKNNFPVSEEVPKPEDSNERDSSNKIISMLLGNKTLIGIVVAFFIIIGLIFRIVLRKKKERDFDYTSV